MQVEHDEFGIPTLAAVSSLPRADFSIEEPRFKKLVGRNLTATEKPAVDTMASEHISYGSSRFYLRTILPIDGPNHVAGIGHEAAVAAFFVNSQGNTITLAYSSETHNWPSYICAHPGAATGTGGNERDNIAKTGSRVDAVLEARRQGHQQFNTWNEPIKQHTDETTRGIADYANAMGIPHMGGSIKYHTGFTGNNLVNVMAISVCDKNRLMTNKIPANGKPEDFVGIYIGKASDTTGLGGVIGASHAIDSALTDLNEKAVQDPDPHLQETITRGIEILIDMAIKEGWKDKMSMKDMGGAGLLCSSLEQLHGNIGVVINGDLVPQNESRTSMELLQSETQERFFIYAHKDYAQKVLDVFNDEIGLEYINKGACARIVGRCNDSGRYVFTRNGVVDVDLPHEEFAAGPLLYNRIAEPIKELQEMPEHTPLQNAIDGVLDSINFKSDAYVYNHYDKHVRSTNIVTRGEGCAPLMTHELFEGKVAYSASFDSNSVIGLLDPKLHAEDSFVRGAYRMATVGCSVIGVTNNANYGRTSVPEEMWQFAEGQRGIAKAVRNWELETEYVDMIKQDKEVAAKFENDKRVHVTVNSGNCSLNKANANTNTAIPPTSILGLVGWTNAPTQYATWDMKNIDSRLVLIGARQQTLGATDYLQASFGPDCIGNETFKINYNVSMKEVDLIIRSVRSGYIASANIIEEGGLANAVSEMMANAKSDVNATVYLDSTMGSPGLDYHQKLFSESMGSVMQIPLEQMHHFWTLCKSKGVRPYVIGEVSMAKPGEGVLTFAGTKENLVYGQDRLKAVYDTKIEAKLNYEVVA